MKKVSEYKVVTGKTPILLSAPHSFIHKRPSLSSKYKQAEPWTDYIVKNISNDIKSFGIFSLHSLEYDPNYYKLEKNEYKKEVKRIIEENKIKYFFDIHGLSNEYDYDFGIQYLNRYPKSRKLGYDLGKALNTGVLRNCLIQILNIPVGKQETLTEFVASELKVPSIQIEISRYIREKDKLREGLIKNISDFLITLS